jgi:hypothetical protein
LLCHSLEQRFQPLSQLGRGCHIRVRLCFADILQWNFSVFKQSVLQTGGINDEVELSGQFSDFVYVIGAFLVGESEDAAIVDDGHVRGEEESPPCAAAGVLEARMVEVQQ